MVLIKCDKCKKDVESNEGYITESVFVTYDNMTSIEFHKKYKRDDSKVREYCFGCAENLNIIERSENK